MSSKVMSYVLVTLCIVLLAVLLWPKDETQVDFDGVSPPLSNLKQQPIERLSSQSEYPDIVQKPLFKASRLAFKPAVAPRKEQAASRTQVKVAPASAPLPDLLGVMHIDGVERAFLKGKNDLEAIGLGIGEQYKGWELTSISATEVVLSKKASDETVALDWGDAELGNNINNSDSKRTTDKGEYIAAGAGFRKLGTKHLKDRLATQIEQDPLELD